MVREGFLLQCSSRVHRGRPVLYLHGRLASGERFLVREHRERPYFYLRAADAAQLPGLALQQVPLTTPAGEPVLRVSVGSADDQDALRGRLELRGVRTFEADLQLVPHYLLERRLRGAVRIHDGAREPTWYGATLVYDDAELEPGASVPALRALSLDIETDPEAQRLLCVGLYGCGADEVLLLTPPGATCPPGATPFPSEEALLRGLLARVRQLDPDVLCGWNVIDFDLTVLLRRAREHGVTLALGLDDAPVLVRPGVPGRGGARALLSGRLVLDGIALLRGASIALEEYSLEAVAQRVLGEGKLLHGKDRGGEILRLFLEDRARLVAYNRKDARLAYDIIARLHLIELAVRRAMLTGLAVDRVTASVAAFDQLYLLRMRGRGFVGPSLRPRQEAEEELALGGGHVLAPRPGLYRHILALDFRSLYPSLIRTFSLDPLGYLPEPRPEDDPIVAPNGAAFRRERGLLPEILDELFPLRERARQEGDEVQSHALKILMNSFYGVLGVRACRFFSPEVANAITSLGREVLLWCQERCERAGHRVLYGDTDSLFVESRADSAAAARAVGEGLCGRLNQELDAELRARYRLPRSYLELRVAEVYLRLLLPRLRQGEGGARKRYVGLVERGGREEVQFTGMEAVRRDWTALARQAQRALYERLFSDQPVEEYLRRLAADLRSGALDELLVYRKSLSKAPEAYQGPTPPHVAAARKRQGGGGRRVEYLITRHGPEPLGERRSPIDYEHYLEHQLRPVAEPVLALLGLSFADLVDLGSGGRQLSLF